MTAPLFRGPFAMAAVSALTLTLLLVSACGEGPTVKVTPDGRASLHTGPDGAVVEVAEDGMSLAMPSDLPDHTPAYPGATLATRVSGGKPGEPELMFLVFRTSDAVDKVAAFYDSKARAAGQRPSMIVTEADSAVRIFGGNSKEAGDGAMVAISRSDDGPGTEIVITSGMGGADIARVEREPRAWRETVRVPVRLQ